MSDRSGFANVWRQGDADGPEDVAHVSGGRGAQDELLPIFLGLDFLQAIELSHHVAPFGGLSARAAALFELLAQHERQKRAKHVAANGGVL